LPLNLPVDIRRRHLRQFDEGSSGADPIPVAPHCRAANAACHDVRAGGD
jgi:hypothetical protein